MEEGEVLCDDENYVYVFVWEYIGWDEDLKFYKEELVFENVELKIWSYK